MSGVAFPLLANSTALPAPTCIGLAAASAETSVQMDPEFLRRDRAKRAMKNGGLKRNSNEQ